MIYIKPTGKDWLDSVVLDFHDSNRKILYFGYINFCNMYLYMLHVLLDVKKHNYTARINILGNIFYD